MPSVRHHAPQPVAIRGVDDMIAHLYRVHQGAELFMYVFAAMWITSTLILMWPTRKDRAERVARRRTWADDQ